MKSVTDNSIDIELMETIEQEYVDSCWKLASSLDTYLIAKDDTSSICKYYIIQYLFLCVTRLYFINIMLKISKQWLFVVFEFCRDFMSSMPTKESADLDGSLIYKLSDSQNRYSFTYI